MKTLQKLFALTLCMAAIGLLVRCDEDDPVPVVSLFSISGTVTFPDFSGTNQSANGAIVYLVENTTEASTNFDYSTVASTNGTYSFDNLEAGNYYMFVNYNTANTNNPGGRVGGIHFDSGEGVLFTITDANVAQDFALVSAGQDTDFVIDNTDGGDWDFDFSHSNIDFEFPYDAENASYTGRFDQFEMSISFDPTNLSAGTIEASIDLLSVNTSSPGGRDSFWDGSVWDYGCLARTFGVEILDDLPVETSRYATFSASGFEAYGDGYLTHGTFTFNGTSQTETLFFRLIEGYEGTSRQGVATRYSSFEGKLEFEALDDYGIESSHLLSETVTVYISNQVTRALE